MNTWFVITLSLNFLTTMPIADDSASLQIPQTDPPPADTTVNVSGHEDPARVPATSASAPATGTTENTRPGRLTLALPLNDTATQYRYAVVPLPKTYSEAIAAAARVFGNFLIDPTPERIVLRLRIKSKENEWIWADVDPSNWEQLVTDND
ncbi:hypothetical protein D9758_007139 [Tetrapyrgos nigripes]|uniref:Uncharacterized protein n=1 Tax=Tetrapyrgos nigripes TaxID=182062 RepID=A0A8H5GD46_9AGAR|nr:hypothetical protein D9758_007139 [Tetrapyrgos nigripes]